jgi:hypothetical protein
LLGGDAWSRRAQIEGPCGTQKQTIGTKRQAALPISVYLIVDEIWASGVYLALENASSMEAEHELQADLRAPATLPLMRQGDPKRSTRWIVYPERKPNHDGREQLFGRFTTQAEIKGELRRVSSKPQKLGKINCRRDDGRQIDSFLAWDDERHKDEFFRLSMSKTPSFCVASTATARCRKSRR